MVSTSQSRSFTTAMTWGCCLGKACASPHEGFKGFTPQIHVDLGSGRREAAAASYGRTDPRSHHDVLEEVGMVLKAFSEFSKREMFRGYGPPFPAGSSASRLFDL